MDPLAPYADDFERRALAVPPQSASSGARACEHEWDHDRYLVDGVCKKCGAAVECGKCSRKPPASAPGDAAIGACFTFETDFNGVSTLTVDFNAIRALFCSRREAAKVKLPEEPAPSRGFNPWKEGYSAAIDDCRAALRAAGVEVES